MRTSNLNMLFNPRSVAIVGASASPGKLGTITLLSTIAGGFKGKIHPINPNEDEILGLKTYSSVKDVPDEIDIAVICTPSISVSKIVEECIKVGVKFGVVLSAGFGELGEDGKKAEKKMAEVARGEKMRLIGPNCMGMGSAASKLYASLNFTIPKPGNVSIVSQSGTLATFITIEASRQGVGINKYVSSGNEADLHLEDFLSYYADDPETKVVATFIEGVRDGRRFMDVSKRITKNKPFIVIKGGTTEIGAAAASSHTGSLSGSNYVFDAVCRQAGIIRVSNYMEMIDLLRAFSFSSLPKGRNVGMVSSQGGMGVLAADACVKYGLNLPKLTKGSMNELNSFLPYMWSHKNPIDITGGTMDPTAFTRSLEVLLQQRDIQSVLCLAPIYSSYFDTVRAQISNDMRDISELIPAEMIEAVDEAAVDDLVKLKKKYNKPIVGIGFLSRRESNAVKLLQDNGILIYETPDQAAYVLSKLADYNEYQKGCSIWQSS